MKWGIETFVRIIFKTVILCLFFFAGYLINERIKYIKSDREWVKDLRKQDTSHTATRAIEYYGKQDSISDAIHEENIRGILRTIEKNDSLRRIHR